MNQQQLLNGLSLSPTIHLMYNFNCCFHVKWITTSQQKKGLFFCGLCVFVHHGLLSDEPTHLIDHPSAVPNLINAPPHKTPQPTACRGGTGSQFTCFSSYPRVTCGDAIHRPHKGIPVVGGHWVSGHAFITACEPQGADRGKVFPGQGSAKMPHARSSVTWPSAILDDS